MTTIRIDRPADLLHDERPPEPNLICLPRAVVDEVLDEGRATHDSIDVCADLGIERNGAVQQE